MAGAQDSYGPTLQGYTALLLTINLVSDTTPPTIRILAPQNNQTYPADNVPLIIYADSSAVRLWYAVDGQGNYTLSGNITLPTLTDGTHKLTLYAQDAIHNTAASEPAYFLTQTIYFKVSANVQPTTSELKPTTTPTDTSGNSETESLPMPLVITISLVVVVIIATLALYLRKDIPSYSKS
jgi:hypothetical protein